jgi:3-mercaptopyruvate sulfurtransferase SseA
VAVKLIGMGYMDVKALKGGWKLWLKTGYPTELK